MRFKGAGRSAAVQVTSAAAAQFINSTMGGRGSAGGYAGCVVAAKPRGGGPEPLNEQVSKQFSRMPVRDTGPELRLRRALHALGLRYRLRVKLPGRPDIVFSRARVAVFVDGCFWHACPQHGTTPKNNREWWAEKLRRNVARDREKDEQLRALGWDVVHVWEHDNLERAADEIWELWRSRTDRSVSRNVGAQPPLGDAAPERAQPEPQGSHATV